MKYYNRNCLYLIAWLLSITKRKRKLLIIAKAMKIRKIFEEVFQYEDQKTFTRKIMFCGNGCHVRIRGNIL